MSAIVEAADLDQAGLTDLLAKLTPPESEPLRLWLEGPDGWALAYWPGLDGRVFWYGSGRELIGRSLVDLLPTVLAGRLFAPSGELRWRRLPVLGERPLRTVFLGRQSWAAGRSAAAPPRGTAGAGNAGEKPEYALLWGLQNRADAGRVGGAAHSASLSLSGACGPRRARSAGSVGG